jgi:lactam utilization protein B
MHGDSPEAVKMAQAVRAAMEKNGIAVKNLREALL